MKYKLNDTFYNSLQTLKIDDDSLIDFKFFKKIQILGFNVKFANIWKIIPYLASKFSRDHFKRLQINIFVVNSQHMNLKI